MNDTNINRLTRRCAAWNESQKTDHTLETYDEERKSEYLRLVWWDLGWEACECKISEIAAQFRKEADDLRLIGGARALGAVIAYDDMANKLEAMFPPEP
jgi:hypothetical protein